MLFDERRGQTFVRLCIARALGGDHASNALDFAADIFGRDDPATRILRAAAGSTIPDETWGAELATYRQTAAEFLETVYAGSIVGRLTGLRRVPLATRTLTIASGATASWVGQGEAKPVTNATFAEGTLDPLKLAAITVLTRELLRLADPMAEETIRRDLIRAVQEAMDLAFIDPDNAGSAGTMPASVTHGVTPVVADPGDFSASIAALVADFQGDLATAFLVGNPVLFTKLAGVEHPLIGARGGELAGIPAIASKAVQAETSPDTHSLVLVDPAGVSFGDGVPTISTATHASIAMIDEAGGEGELVSLWQSNCAAIRVELPTNWRAARPAVSILTGIATGPAEG